MKKDIHPADYRPVIFEDVTSGKRFLIASTVKTTKTSKWAKADEDGSPGHIRSLGKIGEEYATYEVEISSASHPFYTGTAKIVDTAGRVQRFKARTAAGQSKKAALTAKKAKTAK